MQELEQEISQTDSGPERDELERTLDVCKAMDYALSEGFITCEEDEDGELHFFPGAEEYHAEAIEA